MSLAGAQHRLLVHLAKGKLFEPVGATQSTHILKPSHPAPDEHPASVLNGCVTMRLAKAAGLEVPRVDIRYVPEPVHIIDACQLLNKARTFKYSGATLAALREVIDATTNKASTRMRLFRWLAFNTPVANND